MPRRIASLEGARSVHTVATHEQVYGLFTKAGKLFYIGRTGKSLEERLTAHKYYCAREKKLGRVKNKLLTTRVLRRGVTIQPLTPVLNRDAAKYIERKLIETVKPVANIRNTGRKPTNKRTWITEEIRQKILSRPEMSCESLALEFGVAPCTISTIRSRAR